MASKFIQADTAVLINGEGQDSKVAQEIASAMVKDSTSIRMLFG
ncbi:MAG TPA: hypothetical protein VHS06_04630 [Chloroflexota bacterium]|nr:hypothetical protein [Chloroflexota bacterium]